MAARAQSTEVTIRPAHESDLDDVAAIERSVFADPWSRRSFADLVDARQVLFLVASDAKAVIGYAVVLVSGAESELANLAISRIAQRQGLGRRLLEEAIHQVKTRACEKMYLEVRESNENALKLYETCGFKAVGRRARYYARPIEDAIVMRADLK